MTSDTAGGRMNAWSWYWLTWIIVGFGLPETMAVLTSPRNTLSDTVWHWFGVREGMPIWHWSILHIVLLLFMAWLFGHMVFGIWR
jgi:hypothetical protein